MGVNHASLKKKETLFVSLEMLANQPKIKIAHSSRTQIKQVQQDYKQHFSNLFSLFSNFGLVCVWSKNPWNPCTRNSAFGAVALAAWVEHEFLFHCKFCMCNMGMIKT